MYIGTPDIFLQDAQATGRVRLHFHMIPGFGNRKALDAMRIIVAVCEFQAVCKGLKFNFFGIRGRIFSGHPAIFTMYYVVSLR